MAVLSKVPGIEVTIQINGQNITEYDDPQTSGSDHGGINPGCPTVSKYVEAIDDTEFSIKVSVDDDAYAWHNIKHCLRAITEIDGIELGTFLIRPGQEFRVFNGREVYSGKSRRWHRERPKFSAISRDDNHSTEEAEGNTKMVESLGLIQVSFERRAVRGRGRITRPKARTAPIANTNVPKVTGKALKAKAVSHYTSFVANKETLRASRLWLSSMVAGDDGPIAIFRFMYRSKESLKQALVIPRTPSPSPSASASALVISKSVHDMTIAELQRLAQERLDQINWAREAKSPHKSSVKREVSEVEDVDEKPDKARAAKRRAVIIDLTDD
ncbi:hypothetical protein O1611_g7082 [Lasiodiplodia mahajangana]|uniref:Uncharacterized protein n=1 Tax=Lasiodiplodia mahajangana TaxID=1108764 RepID=A0ACC2JGK3_9PEZI|nr:hypothetical protein O1611_g7082 [Lasiodiplodia mahajangana]